MNKRFKFGLLLTFLLTLVLSGCGAGSQNNQAADNTQQAADNTQKQTETKSITIGEAWVKDNPDKVKAWSSQ